MPKLNWRGTCCCCSWFRDRASSSGLVFGLLYVLVCVVFGEGDRFGNYGFENGFHGQVKV